MATAAKQEVEKKLYTLKEAAHYLGRSVDSVRRLIWDRELKVVQHVKKQWVDKTDLDQFIERHKGYA